MAGLSPLEKREIFKYFGGISSGYILDFSNQTFSDFFFDTVGIQIYDEKYRTYGSSASKLNLLKAFIDLDGNFIVGKLLNSLTEHKISTQERTGDLADPSSTEKIFSITQRLMSESPVNDLRTFKPGDNDCDLTTLLEVIRESLSKGQAAPVLDRLHTLMFRFVRDLCSKHRIYFKASESLNALFGKYIKFLRENGAFESRMTEKILKYSIQIYDEFNTVRNEHSFAHSNSLLNNEESTLIAKYISASISFIDGLEQKKFPIAPVDLAEESDHNF